MAELLKNYYNQTFIESLAKELKAADSKFDVQKFQKAILDQDWENRELKDRSAHISRQMHAFLPYAYKKQIEILNEVAPKFGDFTAIIFPYFIELFGQSDYETSLTALETYTKYSTSEFAVRPFLNDRPETIETFYQWSKSDNFHVRRLSSEGCRPLLPWAMKLHNYVKDPSPIIPILERLRNDPEDYVYRSVANNLNDISKNHPELVLDLCEKWVNETKTTRWVCKHALRTLLKKGNQRAMKMFGFGSIKAIAVNQFEMAREQIRIGDSTTIDISIKNTGKTAKFRLEYTVAYLKKNGTHSEKVFQLRETTIKSGEELMFTKKLDFKDLSTRKHYAGAHFIYLKVNGNIVEKNAFTLESI